MTNSIKNILPNVAIIIGLALILSACNSSGKSGVTSALDVGNTQSQSAPEEQAEDLRAYCPKTVLRAGTETYRLFKRGVNKSDPDARKSLRFQGSITEVVRECNYSGGTLNVRVGVAGRVINGPTGESGVFKMPLRIAVTRGKEVLYSELHQINGNIQPGKTNGHFKFVDGNIFIPKPKAENIVIYAGFDEGTKKK